MLSDLKRCPNCGGNPKLFRIRSKNKFYIECDGDCWLRTSNHSNPEAAALEWNSLEKEVVGNET